MNSNKLPVAVIGAGPIGLAAAVHLLKHGETPLILEAGLSVGANISKWAHVRLFSPWEYNIDPASRELLENHGWVAPDKDACPTGQELLDQYLLPLATLPEIQPHLRLGIRVTNIARQGYSRIGSAGREKAPFVVRYISENGEDDILARAVIDASGTYSTPNPLGANGLPAIGEQANQEHIFYGIPNLLGKDRIRYAGRRVLVAGSGHSAFNALLDLVKLAEEAPGTSITWVVRRAKLANLFGGGQSDQLPERGRLGAQLKALVNRDAFIMKTGYKVARVEATPAGLVVSDGIQALAPVDEIIVATGLRPDLEMLREIRLSMDNIVESPVVLAPLIDPNIHGCGSVPPHGVDELKHPESDFFIVGMKSYGRAPTFLMRTGYEQVRSVVLAITGQWEAARQIELVLPDTGVCNSTYNVYDGEQVDISDQGCCGGPAPVGVNACCVQDADAKAVGLDGCGCGAEIKQTTALPVLAGSCCGN